MGVSFPSWFFCSLLFYFFMYLRPSASTHQPSLYRKVPVHQLISHRSIVKCCSAHS